MSHRTPFSIVVAALIIAGSWSEGVRYYDTFSWRRADSGYQSFDTITWALGIERRHGNNVLPIV
jgi:hypothetical protein